MFSRERIDNIGRNVGIFPGGFRMKKTKKTMWNKTLAMLMALLMVLQNLKNIVTISENSMICKLTKSYM